MFNKFFSIFIKDSENCSDKKVRARYGKFCSVFGIVMNVILCALKGLIGFLSGSLSIVSDAVNNLSDASSNVITLFGFRLAERPADEEHPYGHGRYEYIAGLMVALVILVIDIELFKESIKKIITPTSVEFSTVTFIVLTVAIAVKILMALVYLSAGKKIESKTIIATAVDSRNDVLTTLLVLISVIINKVFDINVDGYAGVILSILVFISSFSLIKDSTSLILGKGASKETVDKLKDKLLSYPEVLGIHDLMVHDYGVGNQFASVHVEMSSKEDPLKSHEVIDEIEREVFKETNVHLVIHYDPINIDDALLLEMYKYLTEEVKNLNENITVHDLRILRGVEKHIAIFDMVIGNEIKIKEEVAKKYISQKVAEKYPDFSCNITVEKSYVQSEFMRGKN